MFGVYVHFPYCLRRCPFCDFAVAIERTIPHLAYEQAVLAELEAKAPLFADRTAVSLYFGGGTPGLWRPDSIGRIHDAVRARFGAPREVTVECIPGQLTGEGARALRAAGVNRLSVGIESLDDRSLATLGRGHSAEEGRVAVERARAAGFESISADLMFALPGQSLDDFARQVEELLHLDLPHLSLYQLTIEPGTAFAQRGVRTPEGADFFLHAHDTLRAAGYLHYEISSYARPGCEAVHNSLYWSGGEYLGLGMSAHSFRRLPSGAAERSSNTRDAASYLAAPHAEAVQREVLPPDRLAREAMWLGLRRLEQGVSLAAFRALHGIDAARVYASELERLEGEGLLEREGDRVRATRRGMALLDEVALRFL